MKTVDLHTHSTASDGTLSPSKLVKYAKQLDLVAIALTDHDTIDGLDEAIFEGEKMNVEIVPGIEVSADYKNFELHILGLYINHKNKSIVDFTDSLIIAREKRNEKIINRLNEIGLKISLDEVKNEANGGLVSKGHIIKVMIDKKYIKDGKEGRSKYFYEGGATYF